MSEHPLRSTPVTRSVPLRIRVTLLYTLMGLVLSALFAWATVYIAEDYEHVLVEEILDSQVQDYAARLRQTPDLALPQTGRIRAWLRRPDGTGEIPAALERLPPGIHESGHDSEEGLHMAVFDSEAGRLYFTIDLKDIEELERYLALIMVAVVVLGTLVSAWLGWILADAVVVPVRRLADAVQNLPARPVQTALGHGMSDDELGRLGSAIDDYQARLLAAEEAEHTFFADASHELRTPISVVCGATELLLEDSLDAPHMRPRLMRLDRGIHELSDLLDALLRLARRSSAAATQHVVLRDWLADCLSTADSVADGNVQLQIRGGDLAVALPASDAELVVRGVVRRLVPPGSSGHLQVSLTDSTIALRFIGQKPSTSEARGMQSRPSDRKLGLTLVGRLADRLGWVLDDRHAESGVVVISLPRPQA